MPRGFRVRWFHAGMGLLWLGLVALYWSDLTTGPGHERLRALMVLAFLAWCFVGGQLLPSGDDADEIRRVMRVHVVVDTALLVLVLVWVRWETSAEGYDVKNLVFPAFPVLMLIAALWQYTRADRTAARARERASVAPPAD